MAALKALLENLDDLPDSMHDMYTEKDGKFALNIDGIDDHPAVSALKNALERQKAERRKAVDDLRVYRDKYSKLPDTFDPDEYTSLVEERDRLKQQVEDYEADPSKKGAGDKEKAEAVAARKMLEQKISTLENKHKEEVDKLKKSLSNKDTFIGSLLIDEGLTKALLDVGVGKEFMKAAKALLRSDVKVVETDGSYEAIVETDTGTLDIPKYVSDWAASDDGKAFVPPAKGADSGTSKPLKPISLNDKNPWSKENWNLTAQGQMIRTDRAKAEKFAKAAGHTIPAAA